MSFEAVRAAALVLCPMAVLIYACVTGAALWRGLRLTPLTLPIVTVWVGLLYWALTSGSGWLLLAVIVGHEISLIGWIVYLVRLSNAMRISITINGYDRLPDGRKVKWVSGGGRNE